MNAIPKPAADLLQQTGQLSESVTRPIPGSRKIFVEGSRADIQVPMREIALTQTPTIFGGEENPPVTVYDTSGPYTDPGARIDLAAGLPALRAKWIEERGDTERLEGLSSTFGRAREHDFAVGTDRIVDLVALAQAQHPTHRLGYGGLIAVGQCRFDLQVGGHGASQAKVV